MRDLFVSIAVANPSGMHPLPGIRGVVGELRQWAQSFGMTVVALDDFQNERVTVDKLNQCLLKALEAVPNRVVVHFCGHGQLANSVASWILSPGPRSANQTVDIRGLRTAIATYGPNSIAIWSDACLSNANTIGYPNHALEVNGPVNPAARYDYFLATSEGSEAYSVQVNGVLKPAFSSALLDALAKVPVPESALHALPDRAGRRQVNSQSLKTYLDTEVMMRAIGAPGLQQPDTAPGLDYPDNVFRLVPMVSAAGDRGGLFALDGGAQRERPSSDEQQTQRELEAFMNRSASETRLAFWSGVNNEMSRSGWPLDASGYWAAAEPGSAPGYAHDRTWLSYETLGTGNSAALEVDDGLWTILPRFEQLSAYLMVSPVSGSSAAASSEFGPQETGIRALGWRHREHETFDNFGAEAWDMPMRLLKGALNGSLSANVLRRQMADLRVVKHIDPMLGIVAGYIYDAIGDISAIRRMASYYPQYYQPIPIDLALLARLPINTVVGAGFTIDLPEIEAEPPKFPGAPQFTWEHRDPVKNAPIAGLIPVLRGGWSMLPFVENKGLRRLREAVDELTFAPISTLSMNLSPTNILGLLGIE